MDAREILSKTFQISLLIFVMMVAVEFIELKFSGRMRRYFTENRSLKYVLSSFLGSIPGCSGSFIMDSLYMAGIAGFGGIVATMIATFGDEAFYILSLAADPDSVISISFVFGLFVILFFLGIIGGWLADNIVRKFHISVCKKCLIEHHEEVDFQKFEWKHFVQEHVWSHIFKKHLIRIVLWILCSMVLIAVLGEAYNLQEHIANNKVVFLFVAGIIGVVPLSGPNIVFMTFFADGLIPFSILLTNSIVQDGHGLLPLLGFSLEDSFKIKLFNLLFGYSVGFMVFALGF